MQHRQHIERIFWSRIQILHLIQAAVIGGSFYLMNTETRNFAPALLFFGLVLTIILFIVCIHDWMDAKRNDTSLHNLGHTLGIRRTAERWRIFGWGIRTHRFLYFAIILFILVDLALLFYFVFCPAMPAALCWAIAGLTVAAVVAILIALAWTGKGWKIIHRES